MVGFTLFLLGALVGAAVALFIKARMDKSRHVVQRYELESGLSEATRMLEQSLNSLSQQLLLSMERQAQELSRVSEVSKALLSTLSAPQGRGSWGEVALKRVLELAGLNEPDQVEYQHSSESGRPDALVKLPGGAVLPIDAKFPLTHLQQAESAPSEKERKAALEEHAKRLRTMIQQLGRRSYHEAELGPNITVLFVPIERALSAALAQDPDLIELAWKNRVVLASPTTLLSILLMVAEMWQRYRISEDLDAVGQALGKLSTALEELLKHQNALGTRLTQAVDEFNRSYQKLADEVVPLLDEISAGREGKPALRKVSRLPRSLPSGEPLP